MNSVRAVQFFATPPTAGAEKVFGIQWSAVFEHDEPAISHFAFERLDYCWRRRVLGRQVDVVHLGTDGIDWEDFSSGLLDSLKVGRVER